jgi:hypothetical protein
MRIEYQAASIGEWLSPYKFVARGIPNFSDILTRSAKDSACIFCIT